MAVYVITAEGGWPVDGLSRDPQVGETLEVTRNGEAARSVIAVAPHLDLLALRHHLGAHGLDPSDAPRRARAVFRYLAGSDDVDDDRRRFGDREFQQTREALRMIYFAQLGWLNQGAFRGDLTELLTAGMAFAKLPTGHGIVLEIASDGGCWYAWRRTVLGRVLGLGSTQVRDKWF